MFDISADIFLRNTSYGLHIVRMVPELPFPQLASYIRVLFKKLSSGDALQVLYDIRYGKLRRSGYRKVHVVAFTAFEQMYCIELNFLSYT